MTAIALSLALCKAEVAGQEREDDRRAKAPSQFSRQGGAAASGQPARQGPAAAPRRPIFAGIPQPRLPRDPFRLTEQQQADVASVLQDWEEKQGKIKTFSCDFSLLEYDGTYRDPQTGQPSVRESSGRLYYAPPDKGRYEVFDKPGERGEHWVCDGKAIYQFDKINKRLIERPLPEELRGKAIVDSPLPFVFGSSADKMRQRYWLRVSTPHNNATGVALGKGQLMIEVKPKLQQDAQNFQLVEIILDEGDMLPLYLNQFLPGHSEKKVSRKMYKLIGHEVNSFIEKINIFNKIFSRPRTPLGWKYVVEKPGDPAAQHVDPPLFDSRAARPASNRPSAR